MINNSKNTLIQCRYIARYVESLRVHNNQVIFVSVYKKIT